MSTGPLPGPPEQPANPSPREGSSSSQPEAMASAMNSSEVIRTKRKQLMGILKGDADSILDELDSLLLITQEEYFQLNEIADPARKMRAVLNCVLQKGEDVCRRFLGLLRSFQGSFPDLGQLPGLGCGSFPEGNIQAPAPDMKEEAAKERSEAFEEVLSLLKLDCHRTTKLSLSDVLEVGQECLGKVTLKKAEDAPWHMLRKIMALNLTARITSLERPTADQEICMQDTGQSTKDYAACQKAKDSTFSISPLDVLCVLLRCSDSFLQQEILLKMSMCQFALPLLLPPSDGPCTLMLWAMRDIVKTWRPQSIGDSKGFREESLVLVPMPAISFVRLGACSLSKSKILNGVLSPPHQHQDFFIHRDMESGNVPRRISDGLVEISWYFPGGRETSALFPEPIAVLNLRGDLASHSQQFRLLTEVSAAVFVFFETISEGGYAPLSALKESKAKCHFVFPPLTEPSGTLGLLDKLASVLQIDGSRLLEKSQTMNDAEFARRLQSAMMTVLLDPPSAVTLEAVATAARRLGVEVDEDHDECLRAKERAEGITSEIMDVIEFKREAMKLQGNLWKGLAEVEKELCRMKNQGDTPPEEYKSQLRSKLSALRRQQNEHDLSCAVRKFIAGVGQQCKAEKHYFLKWMKFGLDQVARSNLLKLTAEYKNKLGAQQKNPTQLAEVDQRISQSSLGVEHFMREMGQFYEAECSMLRNGKLNKKHRRFIDLPVIAADLVLEGFPLELVDGDVSNIPLQWITDVLNVLNTKLKGQCRVTVITVLGVQSTGKSTLLNTMFGLQFSVSSGRCTRGAFMLLVKVKEDLREDLGCDFILVIDTEGLKAPELATLEDSCEHDNELATLVIGLSDITMVNMAMENATEMKDILQIVVHAFLRMEHTGEKANCQFVHQHVSNVSAHAKNMRDRAHLLKQLNEMTKAAASMEKQGRVITFSDVMEYDPEKDNWYIPGLWHGVPPMAPVNTGYSEHVNKLKGYLLELIKRHSISRGAKDIPHFIGWLTSLWNAVKHENFIFSFRNSLVAKAYKDLSVKYSEWEWSFFKDMYLWVVSVETTLQNRSAGELDTGVLDTLRLEAYEKLQCGEQKVRDSVQTYFESQAQNLHLIEKYKEDFLRSAKSVKLALERYSLGKCEEAFHIQKTRNQLEDLQAKYLKTMEGKVVSLLEDCRRRKCTVQDQELKREFEEMWTQTLSELHLKTLERRQVSQDMYYQLRKDLDSRGSSVNQMLQKVQSLSRYAQEPFSVKKEHIDLSWICSMKEFFTQEYSSKVNEISTALTNQCISYVDEKVHSKVDYDGTYCRELLHMVNERLGQADVQKLHTTPCFEVDLKLHILGRSVLAFQKMHDVFVQENDSLSYLMKFRSQYLHVFQNLYLKKDECQQRARDFCDQCLKPALAEHIRKRQGQEIVEDILGSSQSMRYSSRSFFQFTVLEKLLEENEFSSYLNYINNYEGFIKSWILQRIFDHYRETRGLNALEKNILSAAIKKVREALKASTSTATKTISEFLEDFCKVLQKDLVISRDNLEVITFQNHAKPDQFIADVDYFLSEMESQLLAEIQSVDAERRISALPFQPQKELFRKVFGCGRVCPFCSVPCEAGGMEHNEHFASVHRPQGLGKIRFHLSGKLVYSLCSSDVVSNLTFRNLDTNLTFQPYKKYRRYYPNWRIQPDPSIDASDYWKFVFSTFNQRFSEEYNAYPADLPSNWKKITRDQALRSIQEVFYMKE